MPKKKPQSSKRKSTKPKIRLPKGPCEPEPPRRPPSPKPTPPWDVAGGPDPLQWLKIGKKR
jgi:hypothetical protein